jgi:tellurite resistance protein TerC
LAIGNRQLAISLLFWLLFNLFALALLALDLRLGAPRRSRAAFARTAIWICLAGAFATLLFFWQGRQPALEFVTGYVIELSLSVDNLFLFLVIFRYFAVPESQQHQVLFWGVVGAMLMRGIFILTGVSLIHRFHWVFYAFGALLIYSGFRLGVAGSRRVDPAQNSIVNVLRRILPVTDDYEDGSFFVRNWRGHPRLYATPLLIALAVIETTDVLFAVDSIPAVLSVTLNAFIVYTSNIFAILGLRSLYFAVSGLMKAFRFLHYGLSLLLVLVGVKMIAADLFLVSTPIMLAAVVLILLISVVASLAFPEQSNPIHQEETETRRKS